MEKFQKFIYAQNWNNWIYNYGINLTLNKKQLQHQSDDLWTLTHFHLKKSPGSRSFLTFTTCISSTRPILGHRWGQCALHLFLLSVGPSVKRVALSLFENRIFFTPFNSFSSMFFMEVIIIPRRSLKEAVYIKALYSNIIKALKAHLAGQLHDSINSTDAFLLPDSGCPRRVGLRLSLFTFLPCFCQKMQTEIAQEDVRGLFPLFVETTW